MQKVNTLDDNALQTTVRFLLRDVEGRVLRFRIKKIPQRMFGGGYFNLQ